jgi:hypothetical protein
MSAEVTLPCKECGSPGVCERLKGSVVYTGPTVPSYMVFPKRRNECLLVKHPEYRACGPSQRMCRSALSSSRQEAIRSWNSMQEAMEVPES